MIYAIGAVGTSFVKMGSTRTSVERRLRSLQTGQPFPLQILATVPIEKDLHRIEKQVHAFLEQERQHGERFAMPMDMATLEALIVRAVAYLAAQEAAQAHGEMADLVRERLQRLRQQRGLTLQGLADLAQVSPSQIWNIESGMRQGERLSLAVAKRLAAALGVSLDYLAAMDATLEAVNQSAPPAPKPSAKRRRRTTASVG
jgi:DNA-binding XRE family transcriptional regulator